jgi:AraC-like DNA-binding protein
MATQGLRFSKPRSLIESDDLILVIMESGRYRGTQLGRDVELGPGDAVVRRDEEVASGDILGRNSIIRVPRRVIAGKIGDISGAIHRRIPADTDALKLLRAYTKTIQYDATTQAAQQLAVGHVHDLVALLLGSLEGVGKPRERSDGLAQLAVIKADIESCLDREDLSVGMLARRHRVSPRHLQKLFENDGTTFSEFVLNQRLAFAHRLLSDPRHAAEKVATIAFMAGFGDVSYFYKAFRRRYGMLPTDVRADAQREPARFN